MSGLDGRTFWTVIHAICITLYFLLIIVVIAGFIGAFIYPLLSNQFIAPLGGDCDACSQWVLLHVQCTALLLSAAVHRYRSFHFPLPIRFFEILKNYRNLHVTVRGNVFQEAERQFFGFSLKIPISQRFWLCPRKMCNFLPFYCTEQ